MIQHNIIFSILSPLNVLNFEWQRPKLIAGMLQTFGLEKLGENLAKSLMTTFDYFSTYS
jgi:hypothetical protein